MYLKKTMHSLVNMSYGDLDLEVDLDRDATDSVLSSSSTVATVSISASLVSTVFSITFLIGDGVLTESSILFSNFSANFFTFPLLPSGSCLSLTSLSSLGGECCSSSGSGLASGKEKMKY